MRRKTRPASFVRRVARPLREFLNLDIHMTEQALRHTPSSTQRFMCAPSRFCLWFLDELDHAFIDLRNLLVLRRPESPSDPTP